MVYAEGDKTTPVKTVDTSTEERNRFSLTDDQVEALAGMAITIETHYGKPMDIEWGLDGESGELFILQARPETVQSRNTNKSWNVTDFTRPVGYSARAAASAAALGRGQFV